MTGEGDQGLPVEGQEMYALSGALEEKYLNILANDKSQRSQKQIRLFRRLT
jgi:hypothetical protein